MHVHAVAKIAALGASRHTRFNLAKVHLFRPLAAAEFGHPLLISCEILLTDTLVALAYRLEKVIQGHGQIDLVLGKELDLLRLETDNFLPEGHHGGVSTHIRDVSARVSFQFIRNEFQIDSRVDGDFAEIDFEQGDATFVVRQWDVDSLLETPS